MPMASMDDGVKLHYEESGSGVPLVFAHEMTGDSRIWEPQMRYFSRLYRCISFDARGYAPSEIPQDPTAYSQHRAADDIAALLRHLKLESAAVVGLSMGAYTALHFGIRHPQMATALVVAGCGHGSARDVAQIWPAQARLMGERLETEGMEAIAASYANSAYRVQFRDKDPRGWAEWAQRLAEHSAVGLARSVREVQAKRPSVLDLQSDLAAMRIPVLLVVGDEDEPTLEMNLYMKRTLPMGGLEIFSKTGHAVNSEEPARFNTSVEHFLNRVALGRWGERSAEAHHTEVWLPDDEAEQQTE
ncbi:MAG: pimeloyl-ACP methyl ester carboxylesterase [Gammaproteobacteria bacterium]|jgi:pimeloyl-ACP methyl ester carboxylesterase